MPWIKQGRIFNLEPSSCRTTHAQVPTPHVFDDFIRVYYACRDTHNQSYPAYFDLSRDLTTVLKVHETSVMERGRPGMFDANGIMPSCVITNGGELWMYYIGWNALRGDGARYQNEIGIAVSKDNGESFQRMFEGPIMGRSPTEPGLAVMPFVMKDGDTFKMWYQSGTGWHNVDGQYEPTYMIKYAESSDGITWDRKSNECVPRRHTMEAQSRPCIMKKKDHLSMWYCYRDSTDYRYGDGAYRVGYARSRSDDYFLRADEDCDLVLGKEGDFDSHMRCYPYVIDIDGRLVMFYNGNDFGQTGVGVAIWEY